MDIDVYLELYSLFPNNRTLVYIKSIRHYKYSISESSNLAFFVL